MLDSMKMTETLPDFSGCLTRRIQKANFKSIISKTVLFGSASSPFMLNATLHHHLGNYPSSVAKDMKDNMYVDNVDQESELIHYYQDSRSIMNEANFNLRSWTPNSSLLHEQTEKDQTADANTVVNILGLRWDPFHDTLCLAPKGTVSRSNQPVSKRDNLQLPSRTYPLGILSPVTVKAKLLIQELWQKKLEWDEPLPTELEVKRHNIAQDIQEATKLILPRTFFPQYQTAEHPIYLHVFTDASPKVYGVVTYLSNGIQSSLVMSK